MVWMFTTFPTRTDKLLQDLKQDDIVYGYLLDATQYPRFHQNARSYVDAGLFTTSDIRALTMTANIHLG